MAKDLQSTPDTLSAGTPPAAAEPSNTIAAAAAARLLPLEGGANFRDLGGLLTESGQTVKRGRLYRSSELTGLTARDLASLESLGLEVLFDLRADPERLKRPSQWPDTAAGELLWRNYPLSGADLRAIVADPSVTAARLGAGMRELYLQLPYEQADSIRTIFELLGNGRTPMLFYCAAGKDRTGAVAALVLDALGVPRSEIYDDYELTNHNIEIIRSRFMKSRDRGGVDDAVWEPLIRADRACLAAMFQTLEHQHGSVQQFLTEHLGLSTATLAAVRHELLSQH